MQDIIYLDNASTSFPKPDVVHDTVRDFYRNTGVNPGRTGCDLALDAEKMIHGTRQRLSAFFNHSLVEAGRPKDPNRLVFTLNATMSLNLIINGTVGRGDHVVTTMVEHNSVIRPVNHKVNEGAEARFVSPDSEGYLDPEDIRKAIKKNTKLVIVNHGSNVTGVVQDLKAIGAVCREEGVPFAVDTAQTAGVLPIDMAECNISFLEPYHLEEYPYRLEAGTQNLAGIAGLSAGLDWIENKGLENIYKHEIELLGMLQDGLSEVEGVKIWGTTRLQDRVATMSITVDNYDASDVGTILDMDYNVQTRTGLHCAPLIHEHHGTTPRGTVRLSVGPFNTKKHIEAAIKAVAETAANRCMSATT